MLRRISGCVALIVFTLLLLNVSSVLAEKKKDHTIVKHKAYIPNQDESSGEDLKIISLKAVKSGKPGGFYLGHPILLRVTVSSTNDVENVGIDFYIQDENENTVFIGNYDIPNLEAGKITTLKIKDEDIRLPADATEGDYTLIGVIDPLNLDGESDADMENNEFKTKKKIHLSEAEKDNPDLTIQSFVLDDDLKIEESIPAFPLYKEEDSTDETDQTAAGILKKHKPALRNKVLSDGTVESVDLYDAHIKGTLIVYSSGVSETSVPIQFSLKQGKKELCPLWVWSESEKSYKEEYTEEDLPANTPVAISVDLLIPPNYDDIEPPSDYTGGQATFDEIVTKIDDKGKEYTYEETGEDTKYLDFVVSAKINPEGNITEYEETGKNNDGTSTNVALFTVANTSSKTSDSLSFKKSYEKKFGNNYVGASIKLSAETSFDSSGAVSTASCSVPAYFNENTFNLIHAEASASSNPGNTAESKYSYKISINDEDIVNEEGGDSFTYDPLENSQDLPPIKSKVYVGVPVDITVNITITWGSPISGNLGEKHELSFEPYIKSDLKATAEVNLVVVKAGINGELSLITDTLTVSNKCDMTLSSDGENIDEGSLSITVENELKGLSGNLTAYASWPSWKSLVSDGAPNRKELPLADWPSQYYRKDTIYDKNDTLTLSGSTEETPTPEESPTPEEPPAL